MTNEKSIKDLEKRIEHLENNLDLALTTLSIVTVQCKNAAVLIEGLSKNQLNNSYQIQEIINAVEGMAASLGMFPQEDIDNDDDTWH